MITPLDIQNKKFKKSFRGYSRDEVDEFLDDIIEDYEKLYIENQEVKDSLEKVKKELKKYTEIEDTLKETLIIAKSTGEDIIENSKERGELIIADSKLKAANEYQKAKQEQEKIIDKINNLEIEFKSIKNKYKSFLQSQLNSVEEFDKVIEKNDENFEA